MMRRIEIISKYFSMLPFFMEVLDETDEFEIVQSKVANFEKNYWTHFIYDPSIDLKEFLFHEKDEKFISIQFNEEVPFSTNVLRRFNYIFLNKNVDLYCNGLTFVHTLDKIIVKGFAYGDKELENESDLGWNDWVGKMIFYLARQKDLFEAVRN